MHEEVQGRSLLLLVLLAAAVAAGWTAVRAGGAVAPGDDAPVVVAGAPISAAELAAAPDRAIERRWLQGEAAERGLAPAGGLAALRGQVADAVAGPDPAPSARRLAAAFEAYHARWRERTACLPAFRDPHADRCGDAAPAAAGVCRWLGEATVCGLAGRRWLVVAAPGTRSPRTRMIRSRAHALAAARGLYMTARRARARATARARERAEARAAAARRVERRRRAAERRAAEEAGRRAAEGRVAAARRAAEGRVAAARRAASDARAADPRLEGAVLAAAQAACRRQAEASDPYLFGFGMQDVVGQAEGLVAARDELARRLRAAAADEIDRHKLAPLLDAIAAGSRELGAIAAADLAGDHDAVAGRAARFGERTEPERAASRRLGLGDCLVSP